MPFFVPFVNFVVYRSCSRAADTPAYPRRLIRLQRKMARPRRMLENGARRP